jgi:hypothetical protein
VLWVLGQDTVDAVETCRQVWRWHGHGKGMQLNLALLNWRERQLRERSAAT